MLASTPNTPYYAVIFSSLMTDDLEGYEETAKRMEELAKEQPGYLGIESARGDVGITVSYWDSLDAIVRWKHNVEHTEVRNKGRSNWYKKYQVRICKVEREYGFEN